MVGNLGEPVSILPMRKVDKAGLRRPSWVTPWLLMAESGMVPDTFSLSQVRKWFLTPFLLPLRAGKKCSNHPDDEQWAAKSDGHHIPRRKSIISISIPSQRLVDRIRHLLNGDQETDGEE